jgi:CCR4-NOT transcription complex subunit 7/8
MNSGIDFSKLRDQGIDHLKFAEHFIVSGLILNPEIHWYGFHTDHDFAYLYRIVAGEDLNMSEAKFHQDLVSHFPNIYDIKIIADHAIHTGFRGSL